MGLWNQSVFDPIFASVLLRTGRTVSNQERLYGIGTRFWRYLVVKYSARPSAKRKAQGAGRFPLCASRLALPALRLALCALRFPPSPGVCRLSLGNSQRVDGAAIERVVAEQVLLEAIEPLDGHCRRLCGLVLLERRLAAEV